MLSKNLVRPSLALPTKFLIPSKMLCEEEDDND
jgi:hypothetical protein